MKLSSHNLVAILTRFVMSNVTTPPHLVAEIERECACCLLRVCVCRASAAMQNLRAMVHGCVPVHASSALYPTDDRLCFLCGAGPDGTGGGKESIP